MSKIIIKIFLGNVAKQTYFFVCGILSESHTLSCDSKQTLMIVLRMAWVKIIKLIPPPPIHLNPFAYWVRLSADNIDMQKK